MEMHTWRRCNDIYDKMQLVKLRRNSICVYNKKVEIDV